MRERDFVVVKCVTETDEYWGFGLENKKNHSFSSRDGIRRKLTAQLAPQPGVRYHYIA
jgi:hypothetical protein